MQEPEGADWKAFFESHAPHYNHNPFTKHTKAEVDFLLGLIPLPQYARILDIGCGTGRHAIEFALRGFDVTGLDFSPAMLAEARREAELAGVEVEFFEADATTFVAQPPYDFAICLCEGAFNLIGPTVDPVTHDLAILKNAAASLKSGGHFVLNALNAFSLIRQLTDQAIEQRSFDPLTMIATYRDRWNLPEGELDMFIRERLYTPPEVAAMLHTAGFEVLNLFGGTAGEWGRRPLKLDEVEAMFVSRKR
ncbi:MAG TPA: class I SAM-dependent methyltransferase [Fimbriimonadaceae bacterium]|nr:class I SAM-dependent methyltransferase [Fimbriimonadaceae bacterium]